MRSTPSEQSTAGFWCAAGIAPSASKSALIRQLTLPAQYFLCSCLRFIGLSWMHLHRMSLHRDNRTEIKNVRSGSGKTSPILGWVGQWELLHCRKWSAALCSACKVPPVEWLHHDVQRGRIRLPLNRRPDRSEEAHRNHNPLQIHCYSLFRFWQRCREILITCKKHAETRLGVSPNRQFP